MDIEPVVAYCKRLLTGFDKTFQSSKILCAKFARFSSSRTANIKFNCVFDLGTNYNPSLYSLRVNAM